ncbi:MAG: DUF932 domain-containing protein [bacterium]
MNEKTSTLIERLRTYDGAKHDEVAPQGAVAYNFDEFTFKGLPIRTTETAEKQLCAACGIPYEFFQHRLNRHEKTSIFNRLSMELADAERLFRFHHNELYGVTSTRYRKLDNIRVLDILQAADDSGIGLKPVRYNFKPDHTRVVLVPDKTNVGELTPSITITNSENGLASLSLWAGVFRFVCTNGLMVPVSDITRNRWFHIGNSDISLPDIGVVLNRSMEYVEMLYESRSQYLSVRDKTDIVTKVAGALGQKVAEKVVDVANREYHGAPTLFHAINSITRAAQSLSFRPQVQSEIERYAATLLAA